MVVDHLLYTHMHAHTRTCTYTHVHACIHRMGIVQLTLQHVMDRRMLLSCCLI